MASGEDYAFEYPPEYGRMRLLKVSDRSWRGFLPLKSERKSLRFAGSIRMRTRGRPTRGAR